MNEEIEQEITAMESGVFQGKAVGVELLEQEIANLCGPPVQTVDVSATIGEVITVMHEGHFGAVVVTEHNKLAGIVTERDLLMKVLGKVDDYRARPVTEIMTADPESLRRDDELVYLLNAMHVGGFRHMPIVDEDDVPSHIVSLRDVLAFLLDHFADEIRNIPPTPYRGERKRYSG